MNPNTPRPGHLFFTPRTPWGTRAGQQTFRQHQRASEDRKPDPAGQKLPADPRMAAADRDIVRQPGNPAPSVKEQLQREIDRNRQQGYASDRDLNVQQKTERDNLMRDTFQPKPQPQPAGPLNKILSHIDGDFSYEGTHPGTDEAPGKELRVRISTQPKQRGEMPGHGPPERNLGDEENWKYLHPAESAEGTQESVKPLQKR